MDCGEDLIDEFISIQRCKDLNFIYNLVYAKSDNKEFFEMNCDFYLPYQIIAELNHYDLNYYNCINQNHCLIQYDTYYYYYYLNYIPFIWEINYDIHEDYDNITDIFQYSCKKISNSNMMMNVEKEEKRLKTAIIIITLIS